LRKLKRRATAPASGVAAADRRAALAAVQRADGGRIGAAWCWTGTSGKLICP